MSLLRCFYLPMLDSLFILLAVTGAYVWTSIPELRAVSLQMSLAMLLLYFLSKRIRGTRWKNILPTEATLETSFLTAGVAVVVGSTGAIHSPFLPLFHLLLFVSVLTINLPANIVKMTSLTVFLWATSSHPFTNTMTIELLSLPFLMPLMILSRIELEELRAVKHLNEIEEGILQKQETRTLFFLGTFLKPKIFYLKQLLLVPQENQSTILKQLELIEQETNTVLGELDASSDTLDSLQR